jgi:hypothetical protein
MLRFLFLRFLPRRLMPLLALFEAYRLYRRFRASRAARPPRRLTVSGTSRSASGTAAPPEVTTMTPPKVDGQLYGG